MKFKIERDETPKEISRITIYIGEHRYRLTETNQGRLLITKTSDGDSDSINVHPCVGNQIELF